MQRRPFSLSKGLPWDVPLQLRRILHHPMLKQLLWLLLWACMSLSAMFASRVLVHYHDFAAPWFLAVLSAGTVAIAARLLVFLIAADDGSSGKDWLQLCLIGVIMWTSVALNMASVRSIPVPVVLLIQVSILLSSGEWCWNVARPAMHHPLVAVCHVVSGAHSGDHCGVLVHQHLSAY
jgi:hypothetical protein